MTGNEKELLSLKRKEVRELERSNELKESLLKVMKAQAMLSVQLNLYVAGQQDNAEAIKDMEDYQLELAKL